MDDYSELKQECHDVLVELDDTNESLLGAKGTIRELETEASSAKKHIERLQSLLQLFETNVPQPIYESVMHQHQRSLNFN